ncbi:hypothetical protein VP1G_00001 [Cytospora mali]|uniref:Uncharacterized protein n=1 Tax=Cytospora mali TaxID=578113 RepID=A0A194UMH8_CYTMA|nr:hypothetical protein VP1G_00001 [Valsa mali var. pyri (nom. inval.)]
MGSKADQILLWGFDRDKQCQHRFKNSTFESFWLQRLYTNGTSHVLKYAPNRKQQEIRFGNNITVLFKACVHLKMYYGHPDFWTIIARGFGAMFAGMAMETATCFMEARKAFLLEEGRHSIFVSAATRAVDGWIAFLDKSSAQQQSSAPAEELRASAGEFFSGLREQLVDSARITNTDEIPASHAHTSARFAPPAGPRKRSPSPSPPGPPPSAKRRQFSGAQDTSDSASGPEAQAPQSLPPLTTTELRILGQAKQDPYQTPSTAHDASTPDSYFPPGASDRPAELKIRGIAQHDSFQSPSCEAFDTAMEERTPEYKELWQTNLRLQTRVSTLEQERKQTGEAIQAMNAKFTSLEQRMDASAAQRAQDGKTIQEMKEKVISLDIKLQRTQKQLADKSETVHKLDGRVASLEEQLQSKTQRPEDTAAFKDIQELVKPLESKMAAMESEQRRGMEEISSMLTDMKTKVEAGDKATISLENSMTILESRIGTADRNSSQMPPDQKALVKELQQKVTSLQTEMDSFGTHQGVDDRIREQDGKIYTLQGSITAVRKMVKEHSNKTSASPVFDDLKNFEKKFENLPCIKSISERLANFDHTIECMVEGSKTTLKRIEARFKHAQGATVCAPSARTDVLSETADKGKTTLQAMPKIDTFNALEGRVVIMIADRLMELQHRVHTIETAQQAQSSVDAPTTSEKLDQLSQKVNGIVGHEELETPVEVDGLFQRVIRLEQNLRRFRDAF